MHKKYAPIFYLSQITPRKQYVKFYALYETVPSEEIVDLMKPVT